MIASWEPPSIPTTSGDKAVFGPLRIKRKPPDPDAIEKQEKIRDFLNRRTDLAHHLYGRELERLHQHHVEHRIPQLRWR